MRRRGVSARLCQRADGPAHRLVGDFDKAVHDLVEVELLGRARVDLLRELLESAAGRFDVEGLLLALSEDLGEEVGQESAQKQVRVCDSERASLPEVLSVSCVERRRIDVVPVARGTRFSAGAFRTSETQTVLERQAGAAARSDSVNVKLG